MEERSFVKAIDFQYHKFIFWKYFVIISKQSKSQMFVYFFKNTATAVYNNGLTLYVQNFTSIFMPLLHIDMTSATMIFTMLNWSNLVPTHWRLIPLQYKLITTIVTQMLWCLKSPVTWLIIAQVVQANNNVKTGCSALLERCEGNP